MRIAVEGNIGCGKSTLLKRLGETGYRVVPEPVEDWHPWLKLNYETPWRWGFALNVKIVLAFAREFARKEEENKEEVGGPTTVYERSPMAGSLVFEPVQKKLSYVSDLESALFAELVGKLSLWEPDVVIYLRTDPHVCLERMKARSRQSEKTVPFDYIAMIHEQHDEVYIRTGGPPAARVHVVDGNRSADDVYNDVLRILESTFTPLPTSSP